MKQTRDTNLNPTQGATPGASSIKGFSNTEVTKRGSEHGTDVVIVVD
ncbi:MAG TPA: hypothetical protein VHS59_07690 [Bacillota bacterium]|nr:hypothetical protein [Bacillota bacterium]